MMYYFMFSRGEYSDYCVGGLYVCDHNVTEEEWKNFVADKSIQVRNARNKAEQAFQERRDGQAWGFYDSPEYKEFDKLPNVREMFISLHNMKEIVYEELWEY